jgi:hypothetical protein
MTAKLYDLFLHANTGKKPVKPRPLVSFETFKDIILSNISNIFEDDAFLKNKYDQYCALYNSTVLTKISGVAAILGFESKNTCLNYWLSRGWPADIALEKHRNRQATVKLANIAKSHNVSMSEAKRIKTERLNRGIETLKNKSNYDEICYSRGNSMRVSYYETKINPKTGNLYTSKEAADLIAQKSAKRATKFWDDVRAGRKIYDASTSLNYYLKKGMTEDEARAALTKRQTTFSKQICIEKHGHDKGLEIFNKRQEKWLATLNSFSDEEKQRILIAKTSKSKSYSQEATKFLIKLLDKLGISRNSEYVKMCDNEMFLWSRDKKIGFYDLAIVNLKIIVEYHGSSFHPNPNLSEDQLKCWINPITKVSAYDQRKRDFQKLITAKEHGYTVFEVWDADDHDSKIIEICNFIKEKL